MTLRWWYGATGNAMREFLHVDDMAKASLFVLELDKEIYRLNTKPSLSHINIGTGKDVTIREMAEIMKKVVRYKVNLLLIQLDRTVLHEN